ncbi:Gfo/Idh/MocA family oxidoreductase [Yoonia sp. GPGPB17]|uniref:Gfo/Idh/MocA family protein n=1 Tax=Yoonia sp. GPGPB17 TaxID=3026147 RepID=UPI0030C4738A
MKELLANENEPKSIVMTVNAGAIPANHWSQDAEIGGGRIIGEACHFIDLALHLVGSPIASCQVQALGRSSSSAICDDKVVVTLGFEDGSFAAIHYLANGHKGFPKERIEVFCSGRILQLDNFQKLKGWGWSQFSKMNLWRQDKGQSACAKSFVDAIRRGTQTPIPRSDIFQVSRTAIEAATMARR